jgi:SpoVK/Ycf46/Vps4 family AAA+-type ATPase
MFSFRYEVPDTFPYSALTRPGRFDRIIAVPLPDIRGRVQLLQHFMKDVVSGECTLLFLSVILSLRIYVLFSC